jgi:hypothetical protein
MRFAPRCRREDGSRREARAAVPSPGGWSDDPATGDDRLVSTGAGIAFPSADLAQEHAGVAVPRPAPRILRTVPALSRATAQEGPAITACLHAAQQPSSTDTERQRARAAPSQGLEAGRARSDTGRLMTPRTTHDSRTARGGGRGRSKYSSADPRTDRQRQFKDPVRRCEIRKQLPQLRHAVPDCLGVDEQRRRHLLPPALVQQPRPQRLLKSPLGRGSRGSPKG